MGVNEYVQRVIARVADASPLVLAVKLESSSRELPSRVHILNTLLWQKLVFITLLILILYGEVSSRAL